MRPSASLPRVQYAGRCNTFRYVASYARMPYTVRVLDGPVRHPARWEVGVHSRRGFLALAAASLMRGQGMSVRTVKAAPRSKPSGRPFLAHFTDIAIEAGLRHPTIYGPVDQNAYIVEAIGCGFAFLDYDNDGWMDILVLSGTRWEGAPSGCTIASTITTATARSAT